MSAAGGFPAARPARAQLEQRYRRLLRLYPREFRARRTEEMLGVLMAGGGPGQRRPALSDVGAIVRGSLALRWRGPRGGWTFALAAFALVAPLFLILSDLFQVAFPYTQSQAARQARIGFLEAHGLPAADVSHVALAHQQVGGPQLLGQPAFLILVAGHLIVAAAVLGGLRRTALAGLVLALALDGTQWGFLAAFQPGKGPMEVLTIMVFLVEAVALTAADPRAARCREGWQHMGPAFVLAIAGQLLTLAFDASWVPLTGGDLRLPAGDTMMVLGFVLTAVGVLLPLPLGLGWRSSLLLGAASYPLVILSATVATPVSPPIGTLAQRFLGPTSPLAAHVDILAILFVPPLLVLGWAVTRVHRAGRRRRGALH